MRTHILVSFLTFSSGEIRDSQKRLNIWDEGSWSWWAMGVVKFPNVWLCVGEVDGWDGFESFWKIFGGLLGIIAC